VISNLETEPRMRRGTEYAVFDKTVLTPFAFNDFCYCRFEHPIKPYKSWPAPGQ